MILQYYTGFFCDFSILMSALWLFEHFLRMLVAKEDRVMMLTAAGTGENWNSTEYRAGLSR